MVRAVREVGPSDVLNRVHCLHITTTKTPFSSVDEWSIFHGIVLNITCNSNTSMILHYVLQHFLLTSQNTLTWGPDVRLLLVTIPLLSTHSLFATLTTSSSSSTPVLLLSSHSLSEHEIITLLEFNVCGLWIVDCYSTVLLLFHCMF